MISSTATYALRAVVYLASQPSRYVKRAEISKATRVPHEYLLKVLHRLDAGKLVEARPGPGGGYRLKKTADEIAALDVVLAVETVPRMPGCPVGSGGRKKLCPLDQLLIDAGRRMEEALAQSKITDLLPRKRARKCQSPKNRSTN